jgi:hypothetical protein
MGKRERMQIYSPTDARSSRYSQMRPLPFKKPEGAYEKFISFFGFKKTSVPEYSAIGTFPSVTTAQRMRNQNAITLPRSDTKYRRTSLLKINK